MLTESVSDPRRANWLTITSMSEDVCWPEEPSTSRPNWELEAEILRLTTRLMLRERELRQARGQLRAQGGRLQQQNCSWRRRMEEKEEQLREALVQKDAEMQNIVSQLLLFEAELRREQARIEDLLGEKDALIAAQQREIERLRRSADHCAPADEDALAEDSRRAVQKLREGLVKIRAIQDVTNVKPLEAHDAERRRCPHRAPQKMKDLKAKRVNPHRGHHRPLHTAEMTAQAIL